MTVERQGINERIICDDCDRRSNWYDRKRVGELHACDVNNITRRVEGGTPTHHCAECTARGGPPDVVPMNVSLQMGGSPGQQQAQAPSQQMQAQAPTPAPNASESADDGDPWGSLETAVQAGLGSQSSTEVDAPEASTDAIRSAIRSAEEQFNKIGKIIS